LGGAEDKVRVAVKGGNTIALGQQIVFEVTSKVPGRLILIDVNAAGEVTQIFPNRFLASEAAGLVASDATTTIPGVGYGFSGFKAVEPAGRGRLLAIVVPATISPTRFRQVETQRVRGFEPVNDSAAYLSQLVDQIVASQTTAPGKSKSGQGFAFAFSEYEIVR
jgi:hypothetical protein